MLSLARTLAMAVGLIGAVFASQLPEFAQQYRQRLGGAIDELRRVVDAFDRDAGASGALRREALERMARSPDELQRRQAASIASHVARLQSLEAESAALRSAGPVRRLLLFPTLADAGVVRRAYQDFEPAIPTTAEGIAAAGAGFIAGWGFVRLIARLFRRPRPHPQVTTWMGR